MWVKTIFGKKKVQSPPSGCACGRRRALCVRWMQSEWVIRNELPCRLPVGNEQFELMRTRGLRAKQLAMLSVLVIGGMLVVAFLLAVTLAVVIRFWVFGGVL